MTTFRRVMWTIALAYTGLALGVMVWHQAWTWLPFWNQ